MEHVNRNERRRGYQTRLEQYDEMINGPAPTPPAPKELIEPTQFTHLGKQKIRVRTICNRCDAHHLGTSPNGTHDYSGGWLFVSRIQRSNPVRVYRVACACSCKVGALRARVNFGRPIPYYDRLPGTRPSDDVAICFWQHEVICGWIRTGDPRLQAQDYVERSFEIARELSRSKGTGPTDEEYVRAFKEETT